MLCNLLRYPAICLVFSKEFVHKCICYFIAPSYNGSYIATMIMFDHGLGNFFSFGRV